MKTPAERFVEYLGKGTVLSATEVNVNWSSRPNAQSVPYDFISPDCIGSQLLAAFDRAAKQQEQLPIELTKALAAFVGSTLEVVQQLSVNATKRSASGS